jgi:hypothetical protein
VADFRVLVCGGRDYADRARVWAELDRLNAERPIDCLVHGDASGADRLAADWATHNCPSRWAFPAEWNRYGKRAGPLRNARMLQDAKPDLVVAFPGGRGTADMVKRARESGVRTIEIPAPEEPRDDE